MQFGHLWRVQVGSLKTSQEYKDLLVTCGIPRIRKVKTFYWTTRQLNISKPLCKWEDIRLITCLACSVTHSTSMSSSGLTPFEAFGCLSPSLWGVCTASTTKSLWGEDCEKKRSGKIVVCADIMKYKSSVCLLDQPGVRSHMIQELPEAHQDIPPQLHL